MSQKTPLTDDILLTLEAALMDAQDAECKCGELGGELACPGCSKWEHAMNDARKQIEALELRARTAWEAGFKLAVGYGDNHVHFAGEQRERQWAKYLEREKQ